MNSALPSGYQLCARCETRAFRPKNAMQKYCAECSGIADRERKREWARRNPTDYDPEARRAAQEDQRARRMEAGAGLTESRGIVWPAVTCPVMGWQVRVAVPFAYSMSKNAIWRSVGAGHVVLREEANAARAHLALTVKNAIRNSTIVQNRLWLDILVQKPDHRGDAVNVVDLVCDAVKDAVGLDDRWYSIRLLDWEVVKTEPLLYVGIGQEVGAVPSQVCSYCGRILPFEDFSRHRSNANGIGRTCRECSRAARPLRSKRTAGVEPA